MPNARAHFFVSVAVLWTVTLHLGTTFPLGSRSHGFPIDMVVRTANKLEGRVEIGLDVVVNSAVFSFILSLRISYTSLTLKIAWTWISRRSFANTLWEFERFLVQ